MEKGGKALVFAKTSVCFSSEMYPRILFLAIALMVKHSISSASKAPNEEQVISGSGRRVGLLDIVEWMPKTRLISCGMPSRTTRRCHVMYVPKRSRGIVLPSIHCFRAPMLPRERKEMASLYKGNKVLDGRYPLAMILAGIK